MGGDSRRCVPRPGGQDGNTLVLFPAALLVVLLLSSLALDAAVAYTAQRRLADLAAAAANDAVAALDVEHYYRQGPIRLEADRGTARARALQTLAGQDRGLEDIRCEVTTSGQHATARCVATVRPVFAPLWWNPSDRLELEAVESARAAES